ncbi:SRPBCC family protein [Yinghuangia seranimata]|uniref:SRPBCC family protein n=1 Tax=Yinghuangia seranimata TaxID=408067 RepID=UPI00248B33AF|nr:SRPBCC family protein [Yinghuangia seranimata]MDI2125412.1 SRPBCC family protein [Yinghuangia seranimata]
MAPRTTDESAARPANGGAQEMVIDRLVQAVEHYLAARATHMVENAGRHVAGAADRLGEAAENGGSGLLPSLNLPKHVPSAVMHAAASGVKSSLSGVTDSLGNAAESAGLTGKKKGSQGKKFTHITEAIDVGVPVDVAYEYWTRYDDFSQWAKGVRSVDVSDDDGSSNWNLKVGPSKRSWRAEVQTDIPEECISWTSQGAKGTTRGMVTFHELGERLTRIIVDIEYHPSGPFEKVGNLWRAQGRRVRLDLKGFRHYVMFTSDEEEQEDSAAEEDENETTDDVEDDEAADEDEDAEDEEDEDEEAEDEDEEDEAEDEYEDEDEEDQEATDDEDDEDDEDEEAADEDEDEDEEDEDEDEDDEDEEEDDEHKSARRPARRTAR